MFVCSRAHGAQPSPSAGAVVASVWRSIELKIASGHTCWLRAASARGARLLDVRLAISGMRAAHSTGIPSFCSERAVPGLLRLWAKCTDMYRAGR